jgi:hypothetical protein
MNVEGYEEYNRLLDELVEIYERGELTRELWVAMTDAAAEAVGGDADLEPFFCYALTEWLDEYLDEYIE